ncbi:hypothetical protein [Chromobacterium amazonense]|uniref:hypothetical protein n=1 Tax=Chromobacterium amazonense TaxID=1382803 RepID=UPI003F7AABCE
MFSTAISQNAGTHAQSNSSISTQYSARDTGIPPAHYPAEGLSRELATKRANDAYEDVAHSSAKIFIGVSVLAGSIAVTAATGGVLAPLGIVGICATTLSLSKNATDIVVGVVQAHRAENGQEPFPGGNSGFGVAAAYIANRSGAKDPDKIGKNVNTIADLTLMAASASTSIASASMSAATGFSEGIETTSTLLNKSPTAAAQLQKGVVTLAKKYYETSSPSSLVELNPLSEEPKALSEEPKAPSEEPKAPSEKPKLLSEELRDFDVSQYQLSSSWR